MRQLSAGAMHELETARYCSTVGIIGGERRLKSGELILGEVGITNSPLLNPRASPPLWRFQIMTPRDRAKR